MKKAIKIAMVAIAVVVIIGIGSGIATEARNDAPSDQDTANACYSDCTAAGNSPSDCALACDDTAEEHG